MSISFHLPQHCNPNSPILSATLDVDDGDLNININGVRVAYISCDGTLCRSYLDARERAQVNGLKFNSEGYLAAFIDGKYQ